MGRYVEVLGGVQGEGGGKAMWWLLLFDAG